MCNFYAIIVISQNRKGKIMKLDTNFIYIAGYAGHGKDTVKHFIAEKYEHEYHDITMAETLKANAATLVTSEMMDITGKESKISALNDLKDNYPDRIFYAGCTTREFLQKIGTEFYRSLDTDIHTKFVAAKLLRTLDNSKRDDVLFFATDIRFPNELNFMLKASQLKNEDLKDYLRYMLKTGVASLPQNDEIIKRFETIFNVDRKDKKTGIILDSVLQYVNEIRNVSDYKREWNLEIPFTNGIPKEEAIKYGYIHIFRPILDPSVIYDKDLKGPQLINEIKNYTGLTTQKVMDVSKYYNISEIEFRVDNINKFGFLRADVRHPSETAVNNQKPEALISTPLKNGGFKNELYNLLKEIELEDTLDNELNSDIKKNNVNNVKRGI